MATQPKFFDIEDTQTGAVYRVETDDPNATYDDAVNYFSTLPEQEWKAFEYKAPAQPQAAPAPQSAAPVAAAGTVNVATQPELAPPRTMGVQLTQTERRIGFDSSYAPPNPKRIVLNEEGEQAVIDLVNDPNVPLEEVDQYLQQRGFMPADQNTYQQWQKVRDTAADTGVVARSVTYQNPFEGLEDTGFLKEIEDWSKTEGGELDNGIIAQVGRGAVAELMDPATFMGWFRRKMNTAFDYRADQLRAQYPDLTDEQFKEIHERYVGWMQSTASQVAEQQAEGDNFWLSLAGRLPTAIASDPTTLIPFARAPTSAYRIGRGLEKAAEGAFVGAVTDVVYQNLAISGFAQEAFDPARTFMSAGLSAAFAGGVQGVFDPRLAPRTSTDATRQINKAFPSFDAIEAPTARKGSTAYKDQMGQVMDGMLRGIETITEGWTNKPDIQVLYNFKGQRGIANNAMGVYTEDGRVLLNAEAVIAGAKNRGISVNDMLSAVTYHEALGHYGLAQKFGEELEGTMLRLYDEGGAAFKAEVDEWMARRPDAYSELGEQGRLANAVEEVLAGWSERNGLLPRKVTDIAADWLRGLGRDMGLDLKYSLAEVRGILGTAQRAVTEGERVDFGGMGGTKYIDTWHGSGSDFDEFDYSYMGSGEGQQVFGWGGYFSNLKAIGEDYKNRFGRKILELRGVESTAYKARTLLQNEAFNLGLEPTIVDNFVTARQQQEGKITEAQIKAEAEFVFGESPSPEQIKQVVEAANFVNSSLNTRSTGKIYNVELPDDAKWLEWENSLKEQPELQAALKEAGLTVVPDAVFRENIKRHAAVSSEYWRENRAAQNDALGPEAQDAAFARMKEIEQEYFNLKDALDRQVSDEADGREIYSTLANKLGSDKEASLFLNQQGFVGNRYLADNVRKNETRKNDGTDVFNYVVFDDKVPKIKAKYMRDDWDPESLSPDDLIYAEDTSALFEAMVRNSPKERISFEALEDEMISRGLTPSQIQRLAKTEQGSLAKRINAFETAMTKLDERRARLQEDIYREIKETGTVDPVKQVEYMNSILAMQEVSDKAFSLQSELGRGLNYIKRVAYTRNKMEGVASYFRQIGVEHLADPANNHEAFVKFMMEQEKQLKTQTGRNQERYKIVGGVTASRNLMSVINFPRAVMSSMDLSAPLRQGILFIGRPEWWSSFFNMFNMIGRSGRDNYDFLMKEIGNRPTYDLMVRAKLAFSEMDGKLTAREESFQEDLSSKIPVIKTIVGQSNQAYSGFLNQLRADSFDAYIKQYEDAGVEITDELLQGLGRWINAASGRAELPGGLKGSAGLLNGLFFSPRLIVSRFNTFLNPVFYAKLPEQVRVDAFKQLLSFGVITQLFTNMVDQFFGDEVEVETDARSSDFGKIIYDDTRFDIGGGGNQFLVFGARSALYFQNRALQMSERYTGEDTIDRQTPEIKTGTGEEVKLSQTGQFGARRYIDDVVIPFFRNKLSPQASFVWDIVNGTDAIGQQVSVEGSLASRLVPMSVSDAFEAYQMKGLERAAMSATAGMFGAGVGTYVLPAFDKDRELQSPIEYTDQDLSPMNNEWVRVDDKGKVELKLPTRNLWKQTLDNYFKFYTDVWVEEARTQSGDPSLSWELMTKGQRAWVVENAKKDAQKQAREDMKLFLSQYLTIPEDAE